jgi:hypothetical protein
VTLGNAIALQKSTHLQGLALILVEFRQIEQGFGIVGV